MHFRCLTDSGFEELKVGLPSKFPFYANKDLATVSQLVSCWEHRTAAFPVNPRQPTLPSMPHSECKDLATFLFTSGTSGLPKIACHTFDNYTYSALGTNQILGLAPDDRWLLSLPLYHVGGIAILFRCHLAKATVVLSELPLLDAILTHGITHLSLVPTQLYRLLQEDPKKLALAAQQLKCILFGGAPLSTSLLDRAIAHGFPVHSTYGLTETSSQVTMDPHPGALPFRELKLADDGEILVRGKTLITGYVGKPLPLDNEGWFATGDLGKWKENGCLMLTGRKDNLFISGGENIQPEEIEHALLSLPEILEAIVVPKSDPEFGMRPAVFIEQEGTTYTLDELKEHLKGRLPSFKIPVSIHSFPPSENTLKRSRRLLADLLQ